MTAQARFKQSDVTRAMRGARMAGFTSVQVKIDPDGNLTIVANDTAVTDDDDWRSKQPLWKDN